MSELKSTIEVAFDGMQTTYDEVREKRLALLNKLESVVSKLELDPNNDSPRGTEVKLATIKTLDDILKSMEGSAISVVRTKMQQKQEETSESTKQMVVELLKNINVSVQQQSSSSGVVVPKEETQVAVEKACQAINQPISDDELVETETQLNQ